MNNQLQFVRWVRQAYPQVYKAALTKVARKTALGGLGDDLSADITFDPQSLSVSDATISSIDDAVNTNSGWSGFDWSGLVDSITGAVTQIAPTVVKTQADLATIKINQQRAQQGYAIGNSLTTLPSFASTGGILIAGVAVAIGLLVLSKKSP